MFHEESWLCTKSFYILISLCNLCVLCVSVVCFCSEFINHRDTENTEVAQRRGPASVFVQSPSKWRCTKVLNSTHGSGWFGSGPFYRQILNDTLIPPTAVGGYFKSSLTKDLNNPPTAVGGIQSRYVGFG